MRANAGIRVIADLVVNHTSIDHPWFQQARKGHPIYRDFYVWSDEKPPNADEGVIFPGKQESIWSYDRAARRWYMHRFYPHQPDLNINNPLVRNEIHKVIGFWLELGLSGFRVDAVPFLIEQVDPDSPAASDPHGYLRDLRDFIDAPPGRRRCCWRRRTSRSRSSPSSSASTATRCTCSSASSSTRRSTWRSSVARRPGGRCAPRAARAAARRASGRNFIKNHDEASLDKLTDAERARGLRRLRAE